MTRSERYGDVWVCEDCYMAHHGMDDESDGEHVPDREPLSELDGFEVTDNTCSNHDGDDETPCQYCHEVGFNDGMIEFTWRTCQGCGSTLGGSRSRLALWTNPYNAYVAECEAENLEPHTHHMWEVHGCPQGPIGDVQS